MYEHRPSRTCAAARDPREGGTRHHEDRYSSTASQSRRATQEGLPKQGNQARQDPPKEKEQARENSKVGNPPKGVDQVSASEPPQVKDQGRNTSNPPKGGDRINQYHPSIVIASAAKARVPNEWT